MARIRTIKPEHWEDKELTKISLQAHLLWIGMWNFSDDEGAIENDPLLIKSKVFPRRTDVRVEQVISWLDQLVKARFLVPFDYNSQGYYAHRTFKTHQRIDKPQTSKIPATVLEKALHEFLDRSNNVPRTFLPVKESIVEESISKGEYRKFAHLKISIEEFEKLISDGFQKKEIDSILDAIENYKKNTNYKSLFLTAKKWLEKEKSFAKKEKTYGNSASNDRVQRANDVASAVDKANQLLGLGRPIDPCPNSIEDANAIIIESIKIDGRRDGTGDTFEANR